ncbi:MAG: hypothetical protein K2W85_04560 [Phycisphaerales bacterium]|nr:hypothetical protein [Phycisphaerales bacterium]
MSIPGKCFIATVLAAFIVPGAIAQPVPLPPAPAGVQVSNEYDFQFVTIGSPGNAPVPLSQRPLFPNIPAAQTLGSVGYEYRISRTEMTYGQYHEFVRAFVPTYSGEYFPPVVLEGGLGIRYTGGPINSPSSYVLRPGFENAPVEDLEFRPMALICNWLHNGKSASYEAFRNGAYDASTFGIDPVTNAVTDQRFHSAAARFWVPTLNEWTKAMHYDPDRNGPGSPGYWIYPTMSDTFPLGGLPATPGAQTNAGFPTDLLAMPIASYVDTQSPWGILDGSGGASELVEWGSGQEKVARGSALGGEAIATDRIDWFRFSPAGGLRLASSVPSPSGVMVGVGFVWVFRRRRSHVCS